MADAPENMTLHLLREMRDEAASFRAEVNGRFNEVDSRFNGVNSRFDKLEFEVAAMRADQGRMVGILEALHEGQQIQGSRLNVIDGRLAQIEKHVGLVKV